MAQIPAQSGVRKFGVFEVDLEAGELRKSGMRQKLAGQPFEALRLLLEHPDEIVSRENLRRRLWPDNTVVDYDLALKKVINRVREALGDSAENPRFIETIPRKGYRFIAQVGEVGVAPVVTELPVSETAAEARRPERNLRLGIALVLGAVAFLALLAFGLARFIRPPSATSAAPQIHSLAVLPLQNLSGDPAQEYFSDGMTDALITDLAQVGSLKVISRTSSMQYKQTKKSLPEIARELNVDGVVEGTVQRSGGHVRITAQLIYGPSDKHLWANSYERDMRDVFALERDVTQDIAHQVLTTAVGGVKSQPRPVDPKVLEAYLQGQYHCARWGQGFGEEEPEKAVKYFQHAIDADPQFAPAYLGLAAAYGGHLQGSSEMVKLSRSNVEKAVELDPNYSEAQAELAYIKWQPDLDWRGAEEGFKKALALNPNNADAHVEYGQLLIVLGRPQEGLRECRISQQLNPNGDDAALCFFLTHDFDGAISIVQMKLEKTPKDGVLRHWLFENYARKGLFKEAIQELTESYSLFGLTEQAAHIRTALAASGYRGAIQQWAREMEHLQQTKQLYMPGNLADAYTISGDKDRALYWLEQAYQHKEMVTLDGGVFYLSVDPQLDPLRSDPRFKDLLHRVGLPR